MIDIHCHILPETDDGASSWDVAVEMCRIAAADGITHMVATPHANGEYTYDRGQHLATLSVLQQRSSTSIEFSLGCDFHLSFENVSAVRSTPSTYTIGETRYLLVELSDYSIPPNLGWHLAALLNAGLHPIITHPERNPIVQKSPKVVLDWVAGGAIIQVTANSLTDRWGKTARKTAEWLLHSDAVHVLATDAHDTKSRPPILSAGRDAAARLTDNSIARALVLDNPQAIVNGLPLPYTGR